MNSEVRYGISETMPKAFRVGPLFPKKNKQAAKQAVAAVKAKQKKQGRLLYDDMKKLAEEATNTGKSLKSFVKKAIKAKETLAKSVKKK
jgi:hypothetical protein